LHTFSVEQAPDKSAQVTRFFWTYASVEVKILYNGAALRRWRFSPQNYLRSSDFKFTKNCYMMHCTATFAKPLLGAGVPVFRVCKPLSLLSFTDFLFDVLVSAVVYFLFSEGRCFF